MLECQEVFSRNPRGRTRSVWNHHVLASSINTREEEKDGEGGRPEPTFLEKVESPLCHVKLKRAKGKEEGLNRSVPLRNLNPFAFGDSNPGQSHAITTSDSK